MQTNANAKFYKNFLSRFTVFFNISERWSRRLKICDSQSVKIHKTA